MRERERQTKKLLLFSSTNEVSGVMELLLCLLKNNKTNSNAQSNTNIKWAFRLHYSFSIKYIYYNCCKVHPLQSVSGFQWFIDYIPTQPLEVTSAKGLSQRLH